MMEQPKPKLIIILCDGKVGWVNANTDVQYAIVDYGRRGTGKNPVLGVLNSDTVECDLKELYNHPVPPDQDDISEYEKIYARLTEEGF